MKNLFIYILSILPAITMAQETVTSEKVVKSPKGMIVVGERPNVRCFEPFGGSRANGERYSRIVNKYADHLDGKVKMFMLIIPTQSAFYTPESVSSWSRPQQPAIMNMYSVLNEKVTPVDAYSAILPHTDEPIYLRTDHHWAPLAAYYAAQEFAKVAEVPFRELTEFEPDTIRNFIGTMNMFSGNNACTGSSENFVFYRPKNTSTKAVFIRYRGKGGGENPPREEDFFRKGIKDGSVGAYSVFMGGDACTVKVPGSISNGRRLLITKDSYGNAIPGYLFNSFEEIHVIDPRYYKKGLLTYINDNNITDWLVTNNASFAHSPKWSEFLELQFK